MTIEDILVTTLGAVLARLLLLRWIGSSDIAEELTGGIKDLIAQVVSGRRNQHKAERVFLEIGEGIAESLGVVFSAEGVDFSDERKQFIAKAVAETIPNITADTALRNMLLKYDLQADLFAKDLISRYPHRQVLDPSEHELYRRIVQESCRRLLEVTASLPNFDLEVFSDLLKNSHHLINLAEESLLRVNHLYNDALTHARGKILQERRFEHTYRQSVVQKLDFVELLGLDVRARSSYRQPLTVAYITLKLQGEDLTSSGVDAPEALATARRVLITGEAGSGKTTLLKWIAVRTANSDFQSTAVEMEKWGEGIPFYIQLREFARMDTPLPPPEEWPRLVSPHIVETMPPRWVHEQLEIGRATVLIDGLDELSQEKRLDTYNWLNDIMMTYYKSRYVITSRPEAIQDEWLYIGFQDFRLSDRFIDEFIDKWNAEIDNILNEDEDESPSRELQIELLRKLAKEFQDEGRKEIGSILGYEPMFINASFIVSKMVWDARTGRTREAHIDILRTYLDNIQDQWQQQLKKEWIRLLSVQRMSNQDVTKFIEQWHSSVAEAEGGLASQHKQLALVAAHFNEELNEHSALRELAATPLLCAMLCALHRERKQELPRDRINLYRACLDTMLRKRDEKTGVDLTDYPLLGKKQMRYLLQDLAYWMMRNDYMALAPKQMVINQWC